MHTREGCQVGAPAVCGRTDGGARRRLQGTCERRLGTRGSRDRLAKPRLPLSGPVARCAAGPSCVCSLGEHSLGAVVCLPGAGHTGQRGPVSSADRHQGVTSTRGAKCFQLQVQMGCRSRNLEGRCPESSCPVGTVGEGECSELEFREVRDFLSPSLLPSLPFFFFLHWHIPTT